MNLTEDTRIIFIHGLASKPPQEDTMRLWKMALIENIRCDSKKLASAMEANEDLFRFAYWANAVPDHLEDTKVGVAQYTQATGAVIGVRKASGKSLHIGKAGWVGAQLKHFGLGMVNVLAEALKVKDDVVNEHMREIRYYRSDQYVADRIRSPLERELRDAWKAGKYVILIAHSMGTFIAYDVLWRFSHRSELVTEQGREKNKYRKKRVDLLVTMGSPLGDPVLRDFMLIERWKNAVEAKTKAERKRLFPTNIAQWYNYSAYGDVVCHDATLEDDFFVGLREHVGGYAGGDLRDYVHLYNPYKNHGGNPNPHKSFGYLIQPKLSQKLREFFGVA